MPVKTLILGKRHAGQPLAQALADLLHLSRKDVEHYLKNRWVRLDGAVCQQPGQRVRAKQRLQVHMPRVNVRGAKPQAVDLPPLARSIHIVHLDDDIVVVDKPAGLTTVRHADETAEFGPRGQRFLPPTLVDLLPRIDPRLRRGRIRAVHRIDKETSGLVILARTPQAESHLGKQFRVHSVERTYLALVRGIAEDRRIESTLVRDRGDGRRGSGPEGQHAVTHVRVLERLGACTLVECRLETGRTHQVRIHLGEAGTPLCGERVYDRSLHGKPLPDPSGATRPLLHAATLAVDHRATGKRLRWQSAPPADMQSLIERFRSPV
jgi:23S rRNA pseudouridine1911/1915/1917 synthase